MEILSLGKYKYSRIDNVDLVLNNIYYCHLGPKRKKMGPNPF